LAQKTAARRELSGLPWVRGGGLSLYVEVKKKLMGMGPQFYRIDLIVGFVIDPHIDNVLGKNVAFQQEVVTVLQCRE
jgi:hypothetical protein